MLLEPRGDRWPVHIQRDVCASLIFTAMSLRRFAQSNSTTAGSPRVKRGFADMGTNAPASPQSPLTTSPNGRGSPSSPATPRTQITYPISPFNSESLSASRKFDWEAARLRKPPPYGSPLQGAKIKAMRKSEAGLKGTPKRIVKKKTWYERYAKSKSSSMTDDSLLKANKSESLPFRAELCSSSPCFLTTYHFRNRKRAHGYLEA